MSLNPKRRAAQAYGRVAHPTPLRPGACRIMVRPFTDARGGLPSPQPRAVKSCIRSGARLPRHAAVRIDKVGTAWPTGTRHPRVRSGGWAPLFLLAVGTCRGDHPQPPATTTEGATSPTSHLFSSLGSSSCCVLSINPSRVEHSQHTTGRLTPELACGLSYLKILSSAARNLHY